MPTAYLDHNIVARDETGRLLLDFMVLHPTIKFVFSISSLYEAANIDRREQAKLRARLFDALPCSWLPTRRDIQKIELRAFIYKQAGADRPSVQLLERLRDVLPAEAKVPPTVRPGQVILGIFNNQNAREPIRSAAADYVHILKPLKDAEKTNEGKSLKTATERNAFISYFLSTLPTFGPNDLPYTLPEKTEMASYWEAHREKLYASCPAFAVEHIWSDIIGGEVTRKTKPNDALDKEHFCGGFSYCDFFVSNDGRLCKRAAAIRASLPMCGFAQMPRSLRDLGYLLRFGCIPA